MNLVRRTLTLQQSRDEGILRLFVGGGRVATVLRFILYSVPPMWLLAVAQQAETGPSWRLILAAGAMWGIGAIVESYKVVAGVEGDHLFLLVRPWSFGRSRTISLADVTAVHSRLGFLILETPHGSRRLFIPLSVLPFPSGESPSHLVAEFVRSVLDGAVTSRDDE